jgi:hypothetical protein
MSRPVKGKIFSKIISGGQTGVDREALDVALELGLELGGWCPGVGGPKTEKFPTAIRSGKRRPGNTRESESPGLRDQAVRFLRKMLLKAKGGSVIQ